MQGGVEGAEFFGDGHIVCKDRGNIVDFFLQLFVLFGEFYQAGVDRIKLFVDGYYA